MTQTKRSFKNVSVALTANVEASWAIPVDIIYFEAVVENTASAGIDANARLSFEVGGTAANYMPMNPDYWTPDGTALPAGTTVYFLSEITNSVKILYAEN